MRAWRDWQPHRQLLLLAVPMILSNITTPLLGLVDTAVVGHMGAAHYLAGASIGALIVTQLYWLCGFLRMSTTGLSAQSLGANDPENAAKTLYQGLALAITLALLILLTQHGLLALGLNLADTDQHTEAVIRAYFTVRIWGAPAALANLVILGWLIGQQRVGAVLRIQVIANLLNAGLDVLFVYGLDAGIPGVALASVMAEYSILLLGGWHCWARLEQVRPRRAWLTLKTMTQVFGHNGPMLVRNLALQLCLAFVTYQGARYGTLAAATNAVLMQFLVLSSLGLDGIAHAAEALVGEAKGQRSAEKIRHKTLLGLLWSSLVALCCSLLFFTIGEFIVAQLTDVSAVRAAVGQLWWIAVCLPLVAHWCYLLDGVFVGLTRAKAMQNTVLLSAVAVFFPLWWWLQSLGNLALWLALMAFMLARGLSLGSYFYWLSRTRQLSNG